MPLEFKNTFVNPNLQIKGDEIPLEQLEKTSNVIQGRYDTSMDNDTKMQSIAKKLAASANPVDRETANQIMAHYGKAFENRAKSGNYQDMQWQTQQDAQDVAGMYEGLSNRNKDILAKESLIDMNKNTNTATKELQKNKFRQSIASTQFKDGILNGMEVNNPNIIDNEDYAKWALTSANNWKSSMTANKNTTSKYYTKGQTLPNGEKVLVDGDYKTMTNKANQSVSKKEVYNELLKMAEGDPKIQASLNQDIEILGYDKAMSNFHNALNGAAEKESFNNQLANETLTDFDANKTALRGLGSANQKLPFGQYDPIPSSNIPSTIKSSVVAFGSKARDAGAFNNNESATKFQNSKNNKTMLYSFASNLIENMDKLKRTNPKIYNSLSTPTLDLSKNPVGINLKKEDYVTPIQAIMKLKRGETLNAAEMSIVNDLMQNENIPMTSNFNYVSTSDPNFKNTIEREYGNEVKTDGQYDTEKAKQALDQKYFGDKNGLTVEKDKPLVLGTAQNYNILDPLTGQIIPAADFFKNEQNNLSSGQSVHTEIVGHPDPSTLQMANNKNEYAQENGGAQYFGDGVVINVNGRQVIMANPGQEHQNTPNAIMANYSQYLTGWNPEEKVMWGTDANNKPIIKTISTTDKYVTLDGKKMTKDEFKFRVWELAQGKTK